MKGLAFVWFPPYPPLYSTSLTLHLPSCTAGLGFISLIYFIWYGNGKGGFVSDVHSSSTQLVEYSFGPGFFMGLFSWFFMGTLATGSPILLFMPIIKEETGDDDHEHDD
jgi:hypothetical protein